MFIFLLYFLLNIKVILSTIIIQQAGIYDLEQDDIAMIFFVEIENICDHPIPVSVHNLRCIESRSDLTNYMYLIGGDMGSVKSKETRNLTLIYPNLYLQDRIGICTVAVRYLTENGMMEIRKDVQFNSARKIKRSVNAAETSQVCNFRDLNGSQDCSPVDCSIKYSGIKSFFNRDLGACQCATECPPNAVFIPKSNTCRMLHMPVCESDLQMIEEGNFEQLRAMSNLVNFQCHYGFIDNLTGLCVCDEHWITSTCSERVYQPSLNIYHMCNIEVNSWGSANRQKLIMTILVLLILALAIVAKMLIAACLLNWCCHFCRNRKKATPSTLPTLSTTTTSSLCGDENCSEVIRKKNKGTRTGVSFSQFEGVTSGEESSDVDSKKSAISSRKSGKSSK